jgi:hypothetical protein
VLDPDATQGVPRRIAVGAEQVIGQQRDGREDRATRLGLDPVVQAVHVRRGDQEVGDSRQPQREVRVVEAAHDVQQRAVPDQHLGGCAQREQRRVDDREADRRLEEEQAHALQHVHPPDDVMERVDRPASPRGTPGGGPVVKSPERPRASCPPAARAAGQPPPLASAAAHGDQATEPLLLPPSRFEAPNDVVQRLPIAPPRPLPAQRQRKLEQGDQGEIRRREAEKRESGLDAETQQDVEEQERAGDDPGEDRIREGAVHGLHRT